MCSCSARVRLPIPRLTSVGHGVSMPNRSSAFAFAPSYMCPNLECSGMGYTRTDGGLTWDASPPLSGGGAGAARHSIRELRQRVAANMVQYSASSAIAEQGCFHAPSQLLQLATQAIQTNRLVKVNFLGRWLWPTWHNTLPYWLQLSGVAFKLFLSCPN